MARPLALVTTVIILPPVAKVPLGPVCGRRNTTAAPDTGAEADAFLRAGASDAVNGQVFNVGGDEPVSHLALVKLLIDAAGTGSYRLVEWPADKKAIDIGSFYADSTRFRETTGWAPATELREGLARTVAYYREHLARYLA